MGAKDVLMIVVIKEIQMNYACEINHHIAWGGVKVIVR